MESLGLDVKILFAQVVNFGLLFLILSKLLYKPIIKLIDDRDKQIKEAVENSEKINKKLEEIDNKKSEIVAKARANAKIEAEEIVKIATEEKQRIIEDAKISARLEIEKGIKTIEAQKDNLITEISDDFLDDVAEKLKKKLTAEAKNKDFPLMKQLFRK